MLVFSLRFLKSRDIRKHEGHIIDDDKMAQILNVPESYKKWLIGKAKAPETIRVKKGK